MKKRRVRNRKTVFQSGPIPWLPIDSRLFPFLSFGHVKGVMKLFLQIEMLLAVGVVIGTLLVVVTKIVG